MIIAIVGAESTGKTTLARDLAAMFQAAGSDAVVVPEYLRAWCDAHGRTPAAVEQAGIAAEQSRRIAEAATAHAVVVADTTALMTAVYSELVFGDASLYAASLPEHRRYDLTLLTSIDLPWQPDGFQRDGPHVQAPVDGLLRAALHAADIDHAVVTGTASERVARAWAAVRRGRRSGTSAEASAFPRLSPPSRPA